MLKSLTLLRLTFRTGDGFFDTSISSEAVSAIVAIELREGAAFDDHERKGLHRVPRGLTRLNTFIADASGGGV